MWLASSEVAAEIARAVAFHSPRQERTSVEPVKLETAPSSAR
jgi:hypothetical protein